MSGVSLMELADCFKFPQPPQSGRNVPNCFAPACDFFATNAPIKSSKKLPEKSRSSPASPQSSTEAAMTEDEQKLLRTASEAIMQLIRDRDDMVAGLTAVFLDLYRVEFQEGRQAKARALLRLQIQRDRLARHSARQIGIMFLDSLIQTVEKTELQPAKPVELFAKVGDGMRG
jgi:hypothetical protein